MVSYMEYSILEKVRYCIKCKNETLIMDEYPTNGILLFGLLYILIFIKNNNIIILLNRKRYTKEKTKNRLIEKT